MRKRIMISVLMIVLMAALIGGATSAWFTADTPAPAADFKAGTVEIKVDGNKVVYSPVEGKSFKNVNPGDCGRISWNIVNTGTKAAELRVKLEGDWLVEEGETLENEDKIFRYAPVEDSGWEMYSTEGQIWLYYTGGPVKGTFGGTLKEDRTVELPLVVAFDGAKMGNEYQGKEYKLGGTVEAVQASNEAPKAVWGSGWEAVNEDNYAPTGLAGKYLKYIKGTDCWKGGGTTEPEEPEEPEEPVEPAKVKAVVGNLEIIPSNISGKTKVMVHGNINAYTTEEQDQNFTGTTDIEIVVHMYKGSEEQSKTIEIENAEFVDAQYYIEQNGEFDFEIDEEGWMLKEYHINIDGASFIGENE